MNKYFHFNDAINSSSAFKYAYFNSFNCLMIDGSNPHLTDGQTEAQRC